MYDMILIRFGEMTLKKKNYKQFLSKIIENIKKKCKDMPALTFEGTNYRYYINLNGEDVSKVIERIDTVVGLSSYSLCKRVGKDLSEIARVATKVISEERPKGPFTFKVETHRGDKNYPLTSIEISQKVAGLVLPTIEGMSVDVHNPELTLSIDMRNEGCYLYTKVIKGLGGYPSGIAGKGLLMISGGIDSPVAGYLGLRKGMVLNAIHYESPPHTSKMALQKVIELLERLSVYSLDGKINLYVVPFTDVQMKIYQNADQAYGITLMRRAMYKIASRFCMEREYSCILNGESIGQVASQTLESMMVVNNVTNLPIIRPLATYDKEDIIALARKIKTYEISIRPYEDCCTIFVPEHPVIKPKLDVVEKEELKCELDEAINEAYLGIKKYSLSFEKKTNVFENDSKSDKFII